MTTGARILVELERRGPLRDSDLAASLQVAHQQVNQAARALVARGLIARIRGTDGVLRNHLAARVSRSSEGEDEPRRQAPSSATKRSQRLGPRAAGTLTSPGELTRLGFVKHELNIIGTSDALAEGDGLLWNTMGELPSGPGLYCFVASEPGTTSLRVMYIGLSTQLSGIAAGTDSHGSARGGQRYGRPRHAGATRKRINAEVARLVEDGQTVTHWFARLLVPENAEPGEFLRQQEEKLILQWRLRTVGWNRG